MLPSHTLHTYMINRSQVQEIKLHNIYPSPAQKFSSFQGQSVFVVPLIASSSLYKPHPRAYRDWHPQRPLRNYDSLPVHLKYWEYRQQHIILFDQLKLC